MKTRTRGVNVFDSRHKIGRIHYTVTKTRYVLTHGLIADSLFNKSAVFVQSVYFNTF